MSVRKVVCCDRCSKEATPEQARIDGWALVTVAPHRRNDETMLESDLCGACAADLQWWLEPPDVPPDPVAHDPKKPTRQ